MGLKDIARNANLRKKREGERVSAEDATNQAANKSSRNSLCWLLMDSLWNGSEAVRGQLVKNIPDEPMQCLVNGIIESWFDPTKETAEKKLLMASEQLVGSNAAWASVTLAEFHSYQGRSRLVNSCLYRAQRDNSESEDPDLEKYIDLLSMSFRIESGSIDVEFDLLEEYTRGDDPLFRGISSYLIGCLGRFKGKVEPDSRINYLKNSINIFLNEEPNKYFWALSTFELSKSDIDIDSAIEYCQQALNIIKQLGKGQQINSIQFWLDELKRQKITLSQPRKLVSIVYASSQMQSIVEKIEMIARSDYSVLILGERGTGKEKVAEAIYRLSQRSNKPYVTVNCATLKGETAQSSLFGYDKGAYTGAAGSSPGFVGQANNGTLFLDEVADLPLDTQTGLLRLIQEGEYYRFNGHQKLSANIRYIAATNKDIEAEIENGRFRADLYDRLGVFTIYVPPLRNRRDDILPLVDHFLTGQNLSLDKATRKFLLSYDFPGNIRELGNLIRKGILYANHSGSSVITPQHLFPDTALPENSTKPTPDSVLSSNTRKNNHVDNQSGILQGISELFNISQIDNVLNFMEATTIFEREYFNLVLSLAGHKRKLAIRALGLSDATFYRKARTLGITTFEDLD